MNTAVSGPRRGAAKGSFLRALRVDLHRAVVSPVFLLTVALMLAWLSFNGTFEAVLNHTLEFFGIPYVLDQALTGTFGLGMLVLVIAAAPYSASFLTDRESGFDRCAMERVGFSAYALSRVVSVALTSFLAFFLAGGLYLGGLSLTGAPHTVPGGGETLFGNYLDLVVQVGPWCYYLVRFTITGLTCAMSAVFSLWISTLIPNRYVALLSPLIAWYTYTVVIFVVWQMTGGGEITRLFVIDYVVNTQVSRYHNGFSFLWAVVYQLTITALCGRGFLRRLRKEQGL